MTGIALTAAELIASGRGILAADESSAAMNVLLATAGAPATTACGRAFRALLVTTPGLARGVSGVMLCDETFRQLLPDGRPFPRALAELGMLPGVRADTGVRPLDGSPGEMVTEGLDGLRDRLTGYLAMGARFAAWRAVFRIGDRQPSWAALRTNAHSLARYTSACRDLGLVPVIELRVLSAGEHTIERSENVTAAVLFTTVMELRDLGVGLDDVVLRLNMVVAGTRESVPPAEVAARTVATLTGLVPREVAGVAFASGGQSPNQATASLAMIARLDPPWPATFAFGHALTDAALAAWLGHPRQVSDGQRALANRVACNVAALQGSYVAALERSYVLA